MATLGEMGTKYLERERKEPEGGELCLRNGKDKQRVLWGQGGDLLIGEC